MDKADIPFLSTGELSRLIESKEVSPVEATEAYLDRIDALDFKFNAYLTVSRKGALAAAEEAEEAIARGGYLGPMHGIPVAVKDQLWTRGIRTTGGSRFLADFFPEEDATVVDNLKKAGAIILGKTNMTEFAIGGPHRRSPPVQRPSQPLGPGCVSGTFQQRLGGSDLGFPVLHVHRRGHGRLDTHSRHLLRYRGPETHLGPGQPPRADAGCLVHGHRRTHIPDRGGRGHHAGRNRRTRPQRPVHLGRSGTQLPASPEWRCEGPPNRGHHRAGQRRHRGARGPGRRSQCNLGAWGVGCGGRGGVSAPHGLRQLSFVGRHGHRAGHQLPRVGQGAPPRVWAGNRAGLLIGSIIPAQAYYKTQKLRGLLRTQVLDAFERYDLLATPTAGRPSRQIDDDPVVTDRLPSVQTALFNLANCPAISLPCGLVDGMPVGLQLGARPGADETVIRAAHAYEQHTEWHTMRPPFG